jgi:hypothetical protein
MGVFDFIYKLSLIGTFGVLIWYTYETYKIRKITTEQKDLQLLPAMMLYIRNGDDDEENNHKLTLRNVGYGTAVAISISPTIFKVEGKKMEFKFKLADQNNTLIPGEEREVDFEFYKNGESSYHNRYRDFYAYFNPSNLESVVYFKASKMVHKDTPTKNDIHIKYQDIHGQDYETTIGFRPEGILVAKPPKRIEKKK